MRRPPHATKALLPLCLAAAGCLAGCATPPPASDKDAVAEYEQTNDPLEPTNRFFYRVNNALDSAVLKPVAQGYTYVVPGPVRDSVHNLLGNLGAPVLLVDDIGQGNPYHATQTLWRFMINSTVGVGGLFDVAKAAGVPGHDTSFGVTLGVWGIPAGPYLYLPAVGPTSPRAVAGRGIDAAADPFTWVPSGYGLLTLNTARTGLTVIDARATFASDIDHVTAGALDPYATFRSLYRQNAQAQVEDARHPRPLTAPAPNPPRGTP